MTALAFTATGFWWLANQRSIEASQSRDNAIATAFDFGSEVAALAADSSGLYASTALKLLKAADDRLALLAVNAANSTNILQKKASMALKFAEVYRTLEQFRLRQEKADQARALLEFLAQREPLNAEILHELSRARSFVGDTLETAGKAVDSIANYKAALVAQQKFLLISGLTPSKGSLRELAYAYRALGEAQATRGMARAGLENCNEALRILQSTHADRYSEADSKEDAREISEELICKGTMQISMEDYDTALENFDQARSIRIKLIRDEPSRNSYRRLLSWADWSIGNAYLLKGDADKAIEHYSNAISNHELLLIIDPTLKRWQRDLAWFHIGAGDGKLLAGQFGEAVTHFRISLEKFLLLSQADLENPNLQRNAALAGSKLGLALIKSGKLEAGQHELESAIDKLQAVVDSGSDHLIWRSQLATMHQDLANAISGREVGGNAEKHYDIGRRLLEEAVEQAPDNLSWKRKLYQFPIQAAGSSNVGSSK